MIKACCFSIASPEYMNQYNVQKRSLNEHMSHVDHVLLAPNDLKKHKKRYPYKDVGNFIQAVRPQVVLDLFDSGYDTVFMLGADIVFFSEMKLETYWFYDAVFTPHITKPIPDDGKFPSYETLVKAGHLNGDWVIYNKHPETIEFLEWQANIHETKCVTSDSVFLDQTWTNFAISFLNNPLVNTKLGHNVAYWNFKQRNLRLEHETWMVDDGPLFTYHFSGFTKDNPELIAKHQNRYIADGDILKLMNWYAEELKK